MNASVQALLDRASRASNLDERAYLRDLATLVRSLAQEQRMQAIIRRWQDVNDLRKPDRAPVWCRPVGCWKELLPDADLLCQARPFRTVETVLRQALIKYDIGDDEILLDHWPVDPVITVSPANWWGVEIGRHTSNSADGAWSYDPPLKSPDDFDKLSAPQFQYDADATQRRLSQYQDILGDAMPVRLRIAPGFDSATIVCQTYADLRGLENLMLDTLVEPGFAHRLARHLTDARIRHLMSLERAGLNATNCDLPMLCSRPFGPPPSNGRYALTNCWCAGNSQEFDQVSPEGFGEFLLPYQMEIFRLFGRVSYGCCENLTRKMDLIIERVPNLRLLTCSAWTDFDRLVDTVGTRFAIMWRQKASDIVFARSADDLRAPLRDRCRRLRGSYYQIVLRELQTLNGDLRRLHDWTRLAIECAAQFA